MGRQAMNESDFVANQDQYKAMFHQVVAVGLNCLVLCMANLKFFTEMFGYSQFDMTILQVIIGTISLLATYNFFGSHKRYEIFKFEELYFHSGGSLKLKDMREEHPDRYFKSIHTFFT